MALRKQLFDRKNFELFCDGEHLKKQAYKDAATGEGGLLLAQQLKYISPTIFEQQYPDLVLVNSGIEVNNEGGYSHTITSLRRSIQGSYAEAKDKSNNGGKISIAMEDSTIKVYSYMAKSNWSEDEVKTYAQENRNLPSEFIAAHSEIYLHDVDKLGMVGVDSPQGAGPATGLLNYANFTADTDTVYTGKTEKENYDVVANLIRAQWAGVNNIAAYKANNVIMPVANFNYLNTTPYNTTYGDGVSILTVLQNNFPDVNFVASSRCNSVGGTKTTVAFSTNRQSMLLRVPQPLMFAPVRQEDFIFKTASKFRIGGLDVLEDKAGRLLTGW